MHVNHAQWAGAVFNDMPWEDAYTAAQNLGAHSAAAFMTPVTQIAYDKIPVTYVVCEKDLVIPTENQMKYVARVEEASGKKPHVVKLDAGHCPNASMPEKLAEVVAEAAVL